MNRTIKGFLAVVAMTAMSFAQAPVDSATAPVAEPAAPAAETVAEQAPAAAPAAVEAAPEEAAPVAVRGADAAEAAPASSSSDVAAPVPAEPVQEPAVVVAPKAVRGADKDPQAVERFRDAKNVVYYETVYTREDGVPVRTVYVAEREGKDTVTMDNLMGLKPMKFKIGAHASVGAYQISGNDWDSDRYTGMNWKAGLMALIPLSEYTMGLKIGAMYEQTKASESYYINQVPTNFEFRQKMIDIPVLFTFKAPSSSLYFDLGVEMSIPLYDKLKISYTDRNDNHVSSRVDLMDDYRNAMDWAFVFGFSIMANQYISLDIAANLGMSDLYDGHFKYTNLNLDASSFNVGITLYPF
ncbi:MAG: outer membrane beta-barrel protein [Fibrobacter sp.]|nr:outer membrane beta-barrel protein [Fibrobacter sp.]